MIRAGRLGGRRADAGSRGGPAAPFPNRTPMKATCRRRCPAAAEPSEIEKEKTFVGEMLTRVFGGTQKKAPEPPPPADSRLAKAEELAKTTIADFASEKLRAPSVAHALHADKPFMDAITNSLATAIAERRGRSCRERSPPHGSGGRAARGALPPDDEIGALGNAPEASPASPAAQAGEQPAAPPSPQR